MIDRGDYFTINRGRQYGKTTTLSALQREFGGEYVFANIDLEKISRDTFKDETRFVNIFLREVQQSLKFSSVKGDWWYIHKWYPKTVNTLASLDTHITKMCKKKKIVLMIDEADAVTDIHVYIQFLRLLRAKFLGRNDGKDYTFHSVILAGITDISKLKIKMTQTGAYIPTPYDTSTHISPWNIASRFDVDMSFCPAEITTMLDEYEADHHSGMDIAAIAQEIYEWTSGYPFLVSRICQIIDEDLSQNWTIDGVVDAVKLILQEQNTLFSDMIKNMENHHDLYAYIYDILILGEEKKDYVDNPIAVRALMFCFLKDKCGTLKVANRIFENRIVNYFRTKDENRMDEDEAITGILKKDVVRNGLFDMELAIRKFAEHYRRLYTEADVPFLGGRP
jgi:hypothetical protein